MAKVKPHKFFKKKGQPEQKHEIKESFKFPSIFRIIPAKRKSILFGLLFLSLYTLLSFAGVRTYLHYKEREKVLVERKIVVAKIAYWQKVVAGRSGYRDGYFQLAVLEYQLGKNTDAKTYLDKAMQIDPNFEDGRRLEKVLNEK